MERLKTALVVGAFALALMGTTKCNDSDDDDDRGVVQPLHGTISATAPVPEPSGALVFAAALLVACVVRR